jgi:putative oxygen-independent coproporphyrinogen III oxidase
MSSSAALLRGLRRPGGLISTPRFGSCKCRSGSASLACHAARDASQRVLSSLRAGSDIFQMKPDQDPTREPIASAYVHLPFCKKKCLYCDFPVVALGQRRGEGNRTAYEGDPMMEAYVDALCREIELTPRWDGTGSVAGGQDGGVQPREGDDSAVTPLRTIYFGGGTPSLLPLRSLERIMDTLRKKFGTSDMPEVTIEADPGTFSPEVLRSYVDMGIGRVSVGVQAFDDDLLKLCGRSHTLYDVYKAIDDVHASNVRSWSLDLISGLPHLDLVSWEKNILRAIDSGPKHISSYDLQVEPKTPFGKMYRPGSAPLPSDADAAVMYSMASEMFRGAGYEHYELSSYAAGESHRCLHNGVYWDGAGYYAFGMGAASYVDGRRVTRPRKYQEYMAWVERFETMMKEEEGVLPLPHVDAPRSTAEDMLTDAVMLQLRKVDGLRLREKIVDRYVNGRIIADVIRAAVSENVQRGLVEVVEDEETNEVVVRLRDPDGFLMSNDVISDVFVALDELKMN